MRDGDKSKDQLISEIRELRRALSAQKASARSDRADAARDRNGLSLALDQSYKDLSDSRDETAASDKALAAARAALDASERNLAKSQERYNILGDLVPFGIWTADARGRITFLSESFLEMSGISPENARDLEWIDQLARPVVLNAVSDWSSSLSERDIWEGDYTASSKDGRRYDILIRGVPILDAEGKTVSWLGINLDISKRRRAEEELRRHKEELEQTVQARTRELEAILSSIPDYVYIFDSQGRFIFANQNMLNFWGLSAEQIRGKTMRDLDCPEEVEGPLAEGIQEVLRTGRAVRIETRHASPTAGVMVYENILAPMKGGEGEVDLVAGSSRDVTWSKEAEKALRQAREEAEAANQAKSEFLANMSHEIRTPMNGIMGMIHLAQLKVRDSAVKNYLNMAKKSAEHLLDLINDILDLSKIEAGKSRLQKEPFTLREELASALEPFAVVAQAKGLAFEWTVAAEAPDHFLGDAGRLRQVLYNLVGNAVKFTKKGKIEVRAEIATDQPEQGVRLVFLIRDTGIGISAPKLASIFGAFEQAHTSAHAGFGGSGLGLTICKRLVEMMDGDIQVESREGEGTAFTFTVVLEVAQKSETHAAPSQDTRYQVRPLRILVAEDERINRIYIQHMLEGSGHFVTLAQNGREALEQLSQSEFDLVLMDIRMPEMSGDEATRIIRNHPPEGVDPRIPVVALTAYALKDEIEHYMESGFNAYLTKPVEMEELNRIIAEI